MNNVAKSSTMENISWYLADSTEWTNFSTYVCDSTEVYLSEMIKNGEN